MIQTLRVFTLHAPSFTIGISFLLLSMLMGTWVARIPDVQAGLLLTDGQLGISMIGLSLGALVGSGISNAILAKLATGKAAIISAIIFAMMMTLPAFAFDRWSLMGALALVGAANGFMNVAINTAATAIEKTHHVSIMSTCHGMYSVGGVIGAASSGWIASLGVPLHWHFTIMALIVIFMQYFLRYILLNMPDAETSGPKFILPKRALLLLAFLCFCIIMCESAIADWSAIYLKNNLESTSFIAGLGYAGFCFSMAIGRFSGDIIRVRWGVKRILQIGSLISVTGLLLLVATSHPIAGVLCFVLIGAGMSTMVPTVYGASAKVPGITPSAGITSVATAGIFGILFGRLLIGNISDLFGLNVALGLMAVLVLIVAGLAGKVKV